MILQTLPLTTFNYVVWAWTAVAVITFLVLLKITAPYGRHSKNDWGPMISNKAGWVIMELPSLLIFSWLFLVGNVHKTSPMWILFAVWVIHYVNRSLVFPFRTKTSGKKMPVLIMLSAVFFNLVNASLNGYYLGYLTEPYKLTWLADPRFLIGLAVFITGFYTNQKADNILLHLRKPGQKEYVIPRGWLFEYVSCPNFFGEIIEWTGFAIMAWNLPAFSFAVWTALNLLPRGIDHHKWYRNKFRDYPAHRKAVIPFLL